MRALRTPLALLAAVVLLEIAPPRAEARVVYPSASGGISTGGVDFDPQVAVDPQTRATVVWRGLFGSDWRIQARRLGADGAPEADVQTLSAVDQDAFDPQVAVDPQGRATVVWRRQDDSGNWRIQSVRLGADGAPVGQVWTLSDSGEDALSPQTAVDSQGLATVAWQRFDGSNWRIQATRLRLSDGAPGVVWKFLSEEGQDAERPQVAVDSQGRATLVWQRSDGSNSRIQMTRLGPGGELTGLLQTLSTAGQSARFAQVAIDSEDRATMVWARSDGGEFQEVQAVRLGADGAPGAVQTLSAPGLALDPQVAIDPEDRATVVWARSDGENLRVQAIRLGADGSPGAVGTLSAAGRSAHDPQIAVDSQGRTTLAWGYDQPGSRIVQAIRLGPGGTSGEVRNVPEGGGSSSPLTGRPHVAVDPQGRPTVVWTRADETFIMASRGALVPPDTQITSGPAAGSTITSSSPTFGFSGSPASDVDHFQCRVDAGTFFPCASPRTIGPLADGTHSFAVRAVDIEGDADPTAAQRSFTVDTSDPPPPPPPTNGDPPPALPAEPLNLPAGLAIARAQIRVGASAAQRHGVRRLVVRGALNPAAAGERVVMRFRAAGRQIVIRPMVKPNGAFQVNRRLRGPQRRAGGGQLRLRYAGNDVLRAVGERLRAARRAVRLRIARVLLRGKRLVVAGRVLPRARRQARIQVEFNRPDGSPAQLATRVKVNPRGRFRTRLGVPPAVRNLGAWVSITHPGRARLHGQRRGRGVGG
jgi:hypothetical protein